MCVRYALGLQDVTAVQRVVSPAWFYTGSVGISRITNHNTHSYQMYTRRHAVKASDAPQACGEGI